MLALLGGDSVALQELVPEEKDRSGVRDIARKAQSNAEEKGLQTLFLTLGMATWAADDDGRVGGDDGYSHG